MSDSASGSGTLRALSDDLAAAVERAGASIVSVHARPRIPASAILWRDGIVVASNHTVRRDDDVPVALPDGTRVAGRIVGRDPGTDLAVLRVPASPSSVQPASLRSANEAPRLGELVLAVGRPGDNGPTATLGIVSAVQGPWRTWAGGEIDQFVRLDLSVHDGFSGGALVDGRGRVIGINSSALARGMAVSIPVLTVERVVAQLLERGHVARGYIGLAMQPVRITESLRERLGGGYEVGAMVVKVDPSGPGEGAGILLGDVVVAIDGDVVGDPSEIGAHISGRAGKSIELTLVRGGSLAKISLVVGERAPRNGSGRGTGEG